MKLIFQRAAAFTAVLVLTACNTQNPVKSPGNYTSIVDETVKAGKFFDSTFNEMLNRRPMYQSYLGIKKDYDKWDDISDSAEHLNLKITQQNLQHLRNEIDFEKLDEATQQSYKLFEYKAEESIAMFPYRFHNYPVNQEGGLHTDVPTLLMNAHRIDSLWDAKAYISRLQKVKPLFDQLILNLKAREEKGIIAPKFTYPLVIGSGRNIITGKPFDKSNANSTLRDDFSRKIAELKDVPQQTKDSLLAEADKALISSVQPAYLSLISYLQTLEKKAPLQGGASTWPDGDKFYQMAVKQYTTTDMTPEEVYQLGVKEVARIHDEIRQIMKKVGYKNDNLQDFFRFVTTDKQFFYPNTEEGRQRYMNEATAYINHMKSRLDELFLTKPKADMLVKAVEPFREKSAGSAFYQQPAPDGTRPGYYYINLYDMNMQPVYQMEALAYHEGIPGHHMQIAIAQELQDMPKFRKYGRFTAYVEGWGLYTELIPKEMGLYQDPYQDFGRLTMELLRAARLVVDPGIHYKKWTREQAIKYFEENTAEPMEECRKAIERYTVWPGQATAYKIGMNKILELRENSKKQLGDKFNIREFHDVVLLSGPVPLSVLEENVQKWVEKKI